MTARWKQNDLVTAERLIESLRPLARNMEPVGSVTMHLETARLYQHKHGYNVPMPGMPVLRLKYDRVDYRELQKYLRGMTYFKNVTHVAAWIESNAIVVAAIVHAPSIKQALKVLPDNTPLYVCKSKVARVPGSGIVAAPRDHIVVTRREK